MDDTKAERMAQRDGFAMAALVGLAQASVLITTSGNTVSLGYQGNESAIANHCYSLAEAMMEVRNNRPLPNK